MTSRLATTPTDAERFANAKRFEERRARPPLRYAAALASFTCICQRAHAASETIINCDCCRRWEK